GMRMSRRLWFALLPLLFVTLSVRAQCPRAEVTPEEAKRQLEECLNSPVSIDFQETPLREVVETMRTKLHTPIVVDEPALEEEGISLDRPITMKLEGVSAKSTLHLLTHYIHLCWVIDDGNIKITTSRRGAHRLVQKTYPIDDLLLTEA